MPSTLFPDDLLDRQAAVAETGVDAVVQMFAAQRSVLEAAGEMSRLSIEAIAHLTRSIVTTILELSDRAAATSTRSVEQLSRTMTTIGAVAPAGTNGATHRKTKDTVAA